MEHVYYTLVGILAMAGIGLVLVSLYKAVMWVADWLEDRRHARERLSQRLDRAFDWNVKENTGRIITDKPISPNQLRALQGLSPFHKHDYKLIRARHHIYEFVCRKDSCGETVEVFRSYFWDGEKTIRQQYEEAISAMREYRIESKYPPASAWQTEDL